MLALEKWALGRPRVLAMHAHHEVLQVPELNAASSVARERWREGNRPMQDRKEWMRFYEQSYWKERTDELFDQACAFGDGPSVESRFSPSELEEAYKTGLIEEHGLPNPLLCTFLDDDGPEILELYESHIEVVRQLLKHGPLGPEQWAVVLQKPEAMFYFAIILPCQIEFECDFWELLVNARAEDVHAMERLLRLDKQCMDDDGIRAACGRLQSDGSPEVKARLTRAFRDPLLRKPSMQKTKVMVAAKIYDMFASFDDAKDMYPKPPWRGCTLSYVDLMALFDAAHQDRGGGLRDPDLHDDVRSFEQAVRRIRAAWASRNGNATEFFGRP